VNANGLHDWILNDGVVRCYTDGCRGRGADAVDLRSVFTMAHVVEALARHALEWGSVEVVDQSFAVETAVTFRGEVLGAGMSPRWWVLGMVISVVALVLAVVSLVTG
jgi:hypothetical protein